MSSSPLSSSSGSDSSICSLRSSNDSYEPITPREYVAIQTALDTLGRRIEQLHIPESLWLEDLHILIQQHSLTESQILDFFQKYRDCKTITSLYARCNQIQKIDNAWRNLSAKELLKLAYYIETMPQTTSCFTRKNQDLLPPRTLSFNHENKTFSVYTKRTVGVFKPPSGSFKKGYSCLRLPLNSQEDPSVAAEIVSLDGETKLEHTENIDAVLKDAKFYTILQGVPGIWKFFECVEYTKENGLSKAKNLLEIGKDLNSKDAKALPFIRKCQIVTPLAVGLRELHKRKIIHGDIKLGNALFKSERIGWIDFGSAFIVGDELPFIFKDGFYGCYPHTPPELYKVDDPSKIDFYKVEVFTFAAFCYEFLFRKSLPISKTLIRAYNAHNKMLKINDQNDPLYKQLKKSIKDVTASSLKLTLGNFIFDTRQAITTQNITGLQAEILSYLLKMLTISENRPSMNEVVIKFEEVQNKYTPTASAATI